MLVDVAVRSHHSSAPVQLDNNRWLSIRQIWNGMHHFVLRKLALRISRSIRLQPPGKDASMGPLNLDLQYAGSLQRFPRY
jgi:hypothetical protein